MLNNFKKVLVLCPHPDDEIGCAGTLSRFSAEFEVNMHAIFFSRCEVEPHISGSGREEEGRKSMNVLGIKHISFWNHHVRSFYKDRQIILERLIAKKNEFNPDFILLPCPNDMHQDHEVVYKEGLRAFKHTNIFGYEMPQNLRFFKNTAFVEISQKNLDEKIKALQNHKSQMKKTYMQPEFIKALAVIRGMQAGVQYAEAFDVIRLVIK